MIVALLSILAGVIAAVPAMGPSSAIIIRRILVGHEQKGLAFAAGYIIAEGLACLAAIWGVELIFYTAPVLEPILKWVGIGLLLAVGLYFTFGGGESDGESEQQDLETRSLGGQFAFGFGLTALNPALVAGWTTAMGAVFSATGIELATWQKWFVPFGIVVGETLWYALLVVLARRFDAFLDERMIDRIIQAVGVVLVSGAVWGAVGQLVGA
jgi:threonine/homoserine/homoserine lactone efflux protein